MQLTNQGLAILAQFRQTIFNLKSNEGEKCFILPSIDLLLSPVSLEVKEKLKQGIITCNIHAHETAYIDFVELYKKHQIKKLSTCIDSVVTLIDSLSANKSNIASFFEKFLEFVKVAKLSVLIPETILLDLKNPAAILRLTYYLIDKVYTLLFAFSNGAHIICSQAKDSEIIDKINQTAYLVDLRADKRDYLYKLFNDELHIREASIIATGKLPVIEQLTDVFSVYNALSHESSYGMKNGYYGLVIKTMAHLSAASSSISGLPSAGQVSVDIRPINHEVSMREGTLGGTLVRRSQFGVNISYEDEAEIAFAPGETDYTLKPNYRLKPELKIAYLAHIERLNKQIYKTPKHEHTTRRIEKLTALQRIIEADDTSGLSALIFEQAKDKKSYLFVAYRQSKTKELIEQGVEDIKDKMLRKLCHEKNNIGKQGYAISDRELLKRLVDKHASFSSDYNYDQRTPINEFFCPAEERFSLQGSALWNYDKKIALDIILHYHKQQLIHPALLTILEEKFPMMYARSFSYFKMSAVEFLVSELKKDILSSFWQDAIKATVYDSPKFKGAK